MRAIVLKPLSYQFIPAYIASNYQYEEVTSPQNLLSVMQSQPLHIRDFRRAPLSAFEYQADSMWPTTSHTTTSLTTPTQRPVYPLMQS